MVLRQSTQGSFVKWLCCLWSSCALIGCDIPGILAVKNESSGNSIYRFEEVSLSGEIETVTLDISNHKGANENVIVYGFGQLWTDERIEEYVKRINYIEIISPSDSVRLTNKNDMFSFLKERRRGLFKNEIKVLIK